MKTSWLTTRCTVNAFRRKFTLGLLGTMTLALVFSPQAMAEQDQWAVNEVTVIIGEKFDALNDCLDSLGDAEECFQREIADIVALIKSGSYVAGFGFAVGAALKYIDNHPDAGGPFVSEVEAVANCVEAGADPQTCARMLDPRVQRLAVLFGSYRELEPACGVPGAVCNRPFDWPRTWPWPFQESKPNMSRNNR